MESTTCCPAPMSLASTTLVPITLASPARWRLLLDRAWQSWRERARREDEWRTIANLDERTRRDVGLAERTPPSFGLPWDFERGRW